MIEKNQELEVEIVSYGSEGQGVARFDGFVIFVPMSLVGEVVKVHIIKVTKSYAIGKIIEIIKPSVNRVNPKCSIFGKCGGCTLQHLEYQKSLDMKKKIVEDAMVKIADLKDANVNGVIFSDNEYGYRNKSAFPLFVNDNKLEICMFRTQSHNPVYVNKCEISSENINKCAKVFKEFANNNFDKKDLYSLRYLVIREVDNKLLVTIVSDKPIKNASRLYYNIQSELSLAEDALGLFWCKKSIDNNVILEGTIKHLLGIKNITTNILGINVEISPKSFFQVNFDVMVKIYSKVQENINNDDVVVDAYSGAGLMSALIAQKAGSVYGIEIVEEATKNANSLKIDNNIGNLININGDMNVELPKLLDKIKKIDTLVVDPPRKGMDTSVIETILRVKPEKVIYVSCNPATLARDLKEFLNDYQVKEIQPFDMFPQTAHVETFVLLSKK